MTYNDATADVQLTGLTPGVTYDFRYYMRQWAVFTRTQDFLFDGDGDGAFESTIRISQDNATLDPPGLATGNQAYAFSYTYTAGASGTLNLKVNRIPGEAGTLHLYGLTNQVVDVADTDGDGLPDAFEAEHTDPESATALNAADDLDNDGLTNLEEFENKTDPNNADSDGDGLEDGDEIAGAGSRPATNPAKADTDGDGLSDLAETNTGVFVGASDTGANPVKADTDDDGAPDGEEVANGTNPNDPADFPILPSTIGPGSGITDAREQDTPFQERLNVDRTFTTLGPGKYFVSDWKLNVHTPGGMVTAMLVRGSPPTYTAVWVGLPFNPSAGGVLTVPESGNFTLTGVTDIYAGFFTSGSGSGIIATDANNSGSGSSQTDHDNSPSPPSAAGDPVGGFSHASLGRTYAFEISVAPLVLADSDGDGIEDEWEIANFGDLTSSDGTGDRDSDGLTDEQEYDRNTDPNNADTDGDDLNDGDEIAGAGSRPATDPAKADTDGDGLSDLAETNTGAFAGASDTGTDPTKSDTDGDGAPDGEEVAAGSDPHDSDDLPPLPDGFALTGPLTDDASSGIDPANDYTHAISGGGAETVNGVNFELLNSTTLPPNFNWTVSSVKNQIDNNNGGWNLGASGVTGPGLQGLLGSFTYNNDGNAGSNQTFTLSALTPGQTYETRLYMRKWDNSTSRGQTATFTAGGQASSSITFFEDHPEELPTVLPNRDSAWYLSYTYTADASGTLAIGFEVQPSGVVQGNPGSFHLYGLTNQAASAPASLEITDISYNAATSSLSIVFNSQPGANYALDYSTTLKEGDWQELDDGIVAEGSQTTVVDSFLISNLPERAWLRVRKVE